MSDGTVVGEEPDHCEACSGGWGHQVDMTNGYECEFHCRVCREAMVVHAQEDDWCCDHRYVGEDLWRSEEYYNQWGCPVCGERGDHRPDCEIGPCPFCGAIGDCAINCDRFDESTESDI